MLELSLYLVSNCFKECKQWYQQSRAKLSSLCIICSLGQVKVPLDKYIMAIYLFLGKDNFFCYFHTPDIAFCIVGLLSLAAQQDRAAALKYGNPIINGLPDYPHAFLKKRRGYCNRLRPSVRPSVRHSISS